MRLYRGMVTLLRTLFHPLVIMGLIIAFAVVLVCAVASPAEGKSYGKLKVNVVKIEMRGINDQGQSVERPIAEVEYVLETIMREIPASEIVSFTHVIEDNFWIYTIFYTVPVEDSVTEKISE